MCHNITQIDLGNFFVHTRQSLMDFVTYPLVCCGVVFHYYTGLWNLHPHTSCHICLHHIQIQLDRHPTERRIKIFNVECCDYGVLWIATVKCNNMKPGSIMTIFCIPWNIPQSNRNREEPGTGSIHLYSQKTWHSVGTRMRKFLGNPDYLSAQKMSNLWWKYRSLLPSCI